MWGLLVKDDTVQFQKDIRPEPSPADRKALQEAGLITVGKRERKGIPVEVTERAWDWASEHLSAELKLNSNAGTVILQAWLTKLHAFMRARNIALADILGPQPTTMDDERPEGAPQSRSAEYPEIRERIRAAYLDIAGEFNRRALLSDIRAKLHDISRQALDEALKRMELEDQASLMPLDNRIDITEADREAALHIGREPRHILWIVR